MLQQEKKLLIIACLTFAFGLLFSAWYRSWFIIIVPTSSTIQHQLAEQKTTKKMVHLSFWRDHSWQQDKTEIIVTQQNEETFQHLVSAWLRFFQQESPEVKQIALQSVAFNEAQTELFISFDHNPFNKQLPTFDKLMWVQGLLKTIREFSPQVTHVRLLANHQPINDPHLEFANPWPIEGFIG